MPRSGAFAAFGEVARGLARFAGCQLALIGWFSFALGLIDLGSGSAQAESFRFAGFFLVPGWLLLRLGGRQEAVSPPRGKRGAP